MPLETADISRLEAEGWKAPEVFTAKGRDGKTDMWGIIIRPSNFDPDKKYPVLEYIYQGPGNQYVPKTFIPYNYFMSGIAELGFIVVMVDGMGTSFRSRKSRPYRRVRYFSSWEKMLYRNILLKTHTRKLPNQKNCLSYPEQRTWICTTNRNI